MEKAAQVSSTNLVSAIASGNTQAEAQLVRQYERGIRLILIRRLADTSATEDILQETFSAAFIAIKEGKILQPERLAGFIRQTALNQLKLHFRKNNRYQTNHGEFLETQPDQHSRDEALNTIEQRQLRDILHSLIGQLSSERDRQLLLRYYLKEEEKSSICNDLKLSPSHFDRVLYRARQRMKQILERHPNFKAALFPESVT